jgi:hypothetical protein
MSVLRLGPLASGDKRAAVRRRALLVALAVMGLAFLAAAVTSYVTSRGGASSLTPVQVVKANRDIPAGTVIISDELGITSISTTDATTLGTYVRQQDEARVIGRTAPVGIAAGYPIPAYILTADPHAALWDASLAVKRMPANLKAGDHVALIVTVPGRGSDQVDLVVMQDVEVGTVQSGAADLWLPPKLVAQMQWYADHGGIVLVKMAPGSVQKDLSAGGPPSG